MTTAAPRAQLHAFDLRGAVHARDVSVLRPQNDSVKAGVEGVRRNDLGRFMKSPAGRPRATPRGSVPRTVGR
jgi:hypothetical protein